MQMAKKKARIVCVCFCIFIISLYTLGITVLMDQINQLKGIELHHGQDNLLLLYRCCELMNPSYKLASWKPYINLAHSSSNFEVHRFSIPSLPLRFSSYLWGHRYWFIFLWASSWLADCSWQVFSKRCRFLGSTYQLDLEMGLIEPS